MLELVVPRILVKSGLGRPYLRPRLCLLTYGRLYLKLVFQKFFKHGISDSLGIHCGVKKISYIKAVP